MRPTEGWLVEQVEARAKQAPELASWLRDHRQLFRLAAARVIEEAGGVPALSLDDLGGGAADLSAMTPAVIRRMALAVVSHLNDQLAGVPPQAAAVLLRTLAPQHLTRWVEREVGDNHLAHVALSRAGGAVGALNGLWDDGPTLRDVLTACARPTAEATQEALRAAGWPQAVVQTTKGRFGWDARITLAPGERPANWLTSEPFRKGALAKLFDSAKLAEAALPLWAYTPQPAGWLAPNIAPSRAAIDALRRARQAADARTSAAAEEARQKDAAMLAQAPALRALARQLADAIDAHGAPRSVVDLRRWLPGVEVEPSSYGSGRTSYTFWLPARAGSEYRTSRLSFSRGHFRDWPEFAASLHRLASKTDNQVVAEANAQHYSSWWSL